jgi:hypothetical protein
MSYLQSVSILGYCIFPLFLIVLLLQLFAWFKFKSSIVAGILIIIAIIWCILGIIIF